MLPPITDNPAAISASVVDLKQPSIDSAVTQLILKSSYHANANARAQPDPPDRRTQDRNARLAALLLERSLPFDNDDELALVSGGFRRGEAGRQLSRSTAIHVRPGGRGQ